MEAEAYRKVFTENKGAIICWWKAQWLNYKEFPNIFVLSCQALNFIPLSQKSHFPMFGNWYSLFKYIFTYSLRTDSYSFKEQTLMGRKHKAYWAVTRGCSAEGKTSTMFIWWGVENEREQLRSNVGVGGVLGKIDVWGKQGYQGWKPLVWKLDSIPGAVSVSDRQSHAVQASDTGLYALRFHR